MCLTLTLVRTLLITVPGSLSACSDIATSSFSSVDKSEKRGLRYR